MDLNSEVMPDGRSRDSDRLGGKQIMSNSAYAASGESIDWQEAHTEPPDNANKEHEYVKV